jgi:ribosomal protein S21
LNRFHLRRRSSNKRGVNRQRKAREHGSQPQTHDSKEKSAGKRGVSNRLKSFAESVGLAIAILMAHLLSTGAVTVFIGATRRTRCDSWILKFEDALQGVALIDHRVDDSIQAKPTLTNRNSRVSKK